MPRKISKKQLESDHNRTIFSYNPFDLSWFDGRDIQCDMGVYSHSMGVIERDGLMIFSCANPGVRESILNSQTVRISISIHIKGDCYMELPPSDCFHVIGRHQIPINSWKRGDMEYFVDGTGLWSEGPFVACSMNAKAFKILVWDHSYPFGKPCVKYPKVCNSPICPRIDNYDPIQDLRKWIDLTQRFKGGHKYYEAEVEND